MTVKGIETLWQIGSVPIYNTEDYRSPSFHPSFRRNHHHRHDPPCLFLQSFCSSCPSYLCSHSQTILPFFFPQVLYGGSSSKVVKHCPLCGHWSRTPGRRRLLRVQLLRHGRHCREVGGSSCQVSSQVHPNEGGLSKGKPIIRFPMTTFRLTLAVRCTTRLPTKLMTLVIMMVCLITYLLHATLTPSFTFKMALSVPLSSVSLGTVLVRMTRRLRLVAGTVMTYQDH